MSLPQLVDEIAGLLAGYRCAGVCRPAGRRPGITTCTDLCTRDTGYTERQRRYYAVRDEFPADPARRICGRA